MGCEIVNIEVGVKYKKHLQDFVDVFNSVLSEKESWFEESNKITVDEFRNKKKGYYYASIDGYGMFEDPFDTAIYDVITEFIMKIPDASFWMIYEASFDNSYERLIEEYEYKDNKLTITTHDNFGSNGEDYDEEFGYGPVETTVCCYEYADGELKDLED